MAEENISEEFRLKSIDETRYFLIEKLNRSELMSEKHNNICATVNYIENCLILGSTITGCVSIFAFAYLVGIPIVITSSATGLNILAVTAAIREHKSIIKKKKKKHNKIVLLANSKLNSIEVLNSKVSINSVISHDEFVLINVLKEYNEMKKEIKNLKI